MKTVSACFLVLLLTACGTVYVPQTKILKPVVPATFFSHETVPKPAPYSEGLSCTAAYASLADYTADLLGIIARQRDKIDAIGALIGVKDGK